MLLWNAGTAQASLSEGVSECQPVVSSEPVAMGEFFGMA